jgi:hypothetical protein
MPLPNSKIQQRGFSPNEVVYASDGGTRLQRIRIHDLSVKDPLLQNPPIRSDLARVEGLSVNPGSDQEEHRAGSWVAFVTEDRGLAVRPIDGSADDIHEVRLPPAGTKTESWLLPPFAVEAIFVAHPTGVLCRVEARKTEGITHLFLAEQRSGLPRLAVPPNYLGMYVFWAGQNGRCLLLDRKTLRTVADWEGPGAIREAMSDFKKAYLGLGRSGVLALRIDGDKLVTDWHRQLDGADWSLACFESESVIATNSEGELLVLDSATGKTKEKLRAPAPLALPPAVFGSQVILATVDGGIHFVSLTRVP